MIPRKWFDDPRTRWWAFGLMLAGALAEVYLQVFHVRESTRPPREAYPNDPAIYASLEKNSSRHGKLAQWAHQFMTLEEAGAILRDEGYECKAYDPLFGLRCRKGSEIAWMPEIEIKAEDGFLRFAKGHYYSAGIPHARGYFEVIAPGFEFADAGSLARYMAGRLRIPELGTPAPDKPVKVRGYREVTEFFKRLGMKCSTESPPGTEAVLPELHCATRSFAGQDQKIVLRFSEDGLPAQLEGIIGGQRATVALAGQPDRTANGHDEVLVRNPAQPWRMMTVVERPEIRAFEEKFAATYAALDEPSKRRVLRVIARQLDERFTADEDDASRPLLQQLDFGALFVRRVGQVQGGREIALKSNSKTYAAFALAECDGLPASEARTCFLEYDNLRPTLRPMLDQAVAEVKSANPGLDSRHPVMERLARLEPPANVGSRK